MENLPADPIAVTVVPAEDDVELKFVLSEYGHLPPSKPLKVGEFGVEEALVAFEIQFLKVTLGTSLCVPCYMSTEIDAFNLHPERNLSVHICEANPHKWMVHSGTSKSTVKVGPELIMMPRSSKRGRNTVLTCDSGSVIGVQLVQGRLPSLAEVVFVSTCDHIEIGERFWCSSHLRQWPDHALLIDSCHTCWLPEALAEPIVEASSLIKGRGVNGSRLEGHLRGPFSCAIISLGSNLELSK